MADGKGYLIPENVQPEGFYCLKVFIPADDLYLYAFAGAFQYFSKWPAWEKSNDGRAALAANAWKSAVEYTYANGWINSCGDCSDCEVCMSKQELIDLIREALDMNINVNCGGGGCGCGCGCGKGGNTQEAPPSDYQPTQPNTPVIPSPVDPSLLNSKCGMANYLAYTLRLSAIQSVNWPSGYLTWSEYFADFFNFLPNPNLIKFDYQPYAVIKGALTGISSTQVITEPLDQIYNLLVCTIYSANTSQAAADGVMSVLRDGISDYFVRSLLSEIASQLPYEMAFDPLLLVLVPAAFANRDCSMCESIGYDWPLDTNEYEWRVGASAEETVSSQFTDTVDIRPDGVEYTATITAAEQNWTPEVTFTPPELEAGEEIVGFTWRISSSSTSGGINDPASGAVRINGDEHTSSYRYLHYLTGYSEIESLSEFDEVDEDNGAQIIANRGINFYARVGISQTPPGYASADVSAVLWCIKLAS